MMKIKLFDRKTKEVEELEEEVNWFIRNKKVIDIKIQSAGENCNYWNVVMVMYEPIPRKANTVKSRKKVT